MSTDKNITTAKKMVVKATIDLAYKEKLMNDSITCFQDEGITIPIEHQAAVKQLVQAQITQFELMKQYDIPVNESVMDRTPLDSSKIPTPVASRSLSSVSADYVTVSAQPWGVVITLSDQAVGDLQKGQGGLAAVSGAIAAAVAFIPGGQIPAAFVGAAIGVIGLHSAVIGLANRGKGVYLTWLWTTLVCLCTLGLPVPTPVR